MFLVGAMNEQPWDSDIPAVASSFVDQLNNKVLVHNYIPNF